MDVNAPEKIIIPSQSITAIQTDTAIEIFHVGGPVSGVSGGSGDFASIEADAGGDLLFKVGAATPGSADTSIGSPTLNGTIDLSTPAAAVDTWGGVEDLINLSANWRCRLVCVRRADFTNNTAFTKAAAQCNLAVVAIPHDTGVSVQTINTYTIGIRVSPRTIPGPGSGGWINRVSNISGNTTFVTAGVAPGYNDGEGALADMRIVVYSINPLLKTQTRIWYSAPLTSGVAFQFDSLDFPGLQDLSSKPGEELLVMLQNSGTGATAPNATGSAAILVVEGYRELSGGVGRTERWHLSKN